MTEPETPPEHWYNYPINSKVYKVLDKWYLEIVVKHPDNPEMPDQLMTIKCDNEWWAKFLEWSIEQEPELLEEFDAEAPEFRYEG